MFIYNFIISRAKEFIQIILEKKMDDIILTEINENLKIYQKKDGLTFGTDAYLLYAYMRKNHRAKAADLGSGTGVISLLSAAKGKFSQIHAFEIQEEFYSLIEKNAEVNNLENIIIPRLCDVRKLQTSSERESFDVVFTNPPYMKNNSGFANTADCKNIARHEENGSIFDFAKSASALLKFGGYFYAVYRPDRLCNLICAMRENKLEPKRMTFVYPRSDMPPCLVLTEAKKGAGASLIITKPLIMNDSEGKYTAELDYIYENGEFNEQYQKS